MNEKEFVAKFLMWYDDYPSLPDVVNEVRLNGLAMYARGLEARILKKTVKKLEKSGKLRPIPSKIKHNVSLVTLENKQFKGKIQK